MTPASPLDLAVLATNVGRLGHLNGLAVTVGDQLVQDVGMVVHDALLGWVVGATSPRRVPSMEGGPAATCSSEQAGSSGQAEDPSAGASDETGRAPRVHRVLPRGVRHRHLLSASGARTSYRPERGRGKRNTRACGIGCHGGHVLPRRNDDESGEPLEGEDAPADPRDDIDPLELPEEEQLVYDLSAWPIDVHAEVAEALAACRDHPQLAGHRPGGARPARGRRRRSPGRHRASTRSGERR